MRRHLHGDYRYVWLVPPANLWFRSPPASSILDPPTTTWAVGEGGHGACPHETIDPVFIQAQLINAFQSIVSRNTPPLEATVVTVGKIEEGGFAPNVIPTRFTFSGTLRSFSERNRDMLRERVRTICRGYGIAYECEISVEYQLTGLKAAGYPPVVSLDVLGCVCVGVCPGRAWLRSKRCLLVCPFCPLQV